MLNTLLKIGQWQSEGKSEWDRFLEKPKIKATDNRGNELKNYIISLIFDLDNKDIKIDSDNLVEYDDKYLEKLKALKIQGGNNKAVYVTAPAGKLIQIYKTFFGKEGEETKEGELAEAIKKVNPAFLNGEFSNILKDIFELKDVFLKELTIYNANKEINEITPKTIEKKLNLSQNQNLALITVKVKSQKYFGSETKLFAEIPEYLEFLEQRFFEKKAPNKKNTGKDEEKRLCYASGEITENVEGLDLSSRFSLNKMFVEETKNYASNFDKNRFRFNYQVSKNNQEKLDYASGFLLNENGLRVRIANIDHVIIPQFPEAVEIDFELTLEKIKSKADLLFSFNALDHFVKNIEDEMPDIFWLNFVAYESDGNYFKSTETIKDVSSFHFQKIIQSFSDVHWQLKEESFLDWNGIMTEFGKAGRFFNFNSVYSLIPLRKEKEKKNKALELFKSIFENRPIKKQILFEYFCELMLCHYFERYNSYTNIPKSSSDYLKKSIRDSVFKYHAFIQVLKQLKLIDMNEETYPASDEKANKYDQAIRDFFDKMQLNRHQQAMFYLGRMLNSVEFIQKGKKKTVIEKVNFNGMDRDDIQRLRISLVEKAKQYGKVGKVVFTDSKIGELFDFNNWKMDPQEAVFFLLTGYSFGITSKQVDELEESENEIQKAE
ncbi:MAG: TM1802 family CRISPR-associated protein [Mariniphaga sp.]